MGAAPAPDSVEESSLIGDLGDSKCWPPGFRFHPTDEELVLYYLKRKICRRRIKPSVIGDVDVYKLEPWELPGKSALRSGDKQWYFFSPRDRKYPNGSRSNRATKCGYWKATGKDRTISNNSKPVGNKKTLVYYQGRAPRGQRTDWVMHEYSMDDQALVNCGNVQDSYALYKLFRKSGPGPKNGEQYGAPFREDEWEDNANDAADDSLKNEEENLCQISENLDGDCNPTCGANVLPIDDLEDILLQMSEEQDMIMQQSTCPTYPTEVDVELHGGSCIMEQSQAEPSTKHTDAWCELDGLDTGFQILQSGSTCLQAAKVSEVTLFTDYTAEGQLQAIEEFVEINDISNSQDIDQRVDSTRKEEPVNLIDELYDPDEYFDTSMFLGEAMVTPDRTNPYLFLADLVEEEQFQASHITTELWAHEQAHSMPTSAEPTRVIMERPPSGAVYTSNILNFGEQTPNQGTQVGGVSESWFSSTISTLLDSVPSRPASASENVLINKALVRMSSFRSAQSTMNEQNAVAGGPIIERRRRGQGGGFLFISLLVGLGAIFWMLTIGVAVKVLKGFWSRFVSS